jgi:hypothetical protein
MLLFGLFVVVGIIAVFSIFAGGVVGLTREQTKLARMSPYERKVADAMESRKIELAVTTKAYRKQSPEVRARERERVIRKYDARLKRLKEEESEGIKASLTGDV